MMNDDDVVVARASGREAVEELRSSGALDALFERLDAGEIEMTGSLSGGHMSVRRNYQLFDPEGCGPVGRGRAHPQLSRQ